MDVTTSAVDVIPTLPMLVLYVKVMWETVARLPDTRKSQIIHEKEGAKKLHDTHLYVATKTIVRGFLTTQLLAQVPRFILLGTPIIHSQTAGYS